MFVAMALSLIPVFLVGRAKIYALNHVSMLIFTRYIQLL